MDLKKWIDLNDECCRLSDELALCFDEERRCMVEFKTEELQQNNLKKDELIRALTKARAEFKAYGKEEELLTTPTGRALKAKWLSSWERMKTRCESNQAFIGHSLKNLEMISDNLMRLLGQLSLYNNRGNKIDLSVHKPAGKVVEGTY